VQLLEVGGTRIDDDQFAAFVLVLLLVMLIGCVLEELIVFVVL